MAKSCEICGKQLGLFSVKYKIFDDKIICSNCKKDSGVTENLDWETAEVLATDMNNDVGEQYLIKIGSDLSKKHRMEVEEQKEVEKKQQEDRLNAARETLQKAKEREERQLIAAFKVAGISNYDINKAVNYAKRQDLFEPYDGYTASDIKEMPYSEFYEVDFSNCVDKVNLVAEPENKYDKNAIRVEITIKEKRFMIGYVPKKRNEEIKKIIDEYSSKASQLSVDYELTGGKFKIAEEDDMDFSDNPKLKIAVNNLNYGFNIRLLDLSK
ncbi:hypothetical protein LFYK43_16850 [Ligilactobacillus salitolerans]|uniref:HIRAN domain-containing protein n=1 Tax=Ligilactobacillus salitolerans TaxID=1808352 RepID=A0A401IUN4_9LACO|nr:HIRAN domain-containing protein [Ligilactobacillus salitolerans]GBG95226.1 hypothetical protein LFYK43_16850 [Ligilactobacillus salitolerans]